MQNLSKLVSQWRIWINRNKSFESKELDELENHLLEEIDYLTEKDGLSEEEAFQKVVSVMGGREALDKEFVKTKPVGPKAVHWVKTHSLQIYASLLLLIVFLVSDLVYSSFHFAEVYEPVSKNYEYKSSVNNSYALMTPFSEINTSNMMTLKVKPNIPDKSNGKSVIFNNTITVTSNPIKIGSSTSSYRITFDIRNHDINPDGTITIVFPENTISPSSSEIFETINWETKTPNKMVTEPSLICDANIFYGNYYIILDDEGKLWIEQSTKFTINSTKVDLKTQNLAKNQFILDKSIIYRKGLGQDINSLLYIKPHPSPDDPKFITIKPIDPYQVLLFQKEPNGVMTIRLQLIKLQNQKNPILVWDEVKLIRKPIHLWNKLKESLGAMFFRDFN